MKFVYGQEFISEGNAGNSFSIDESFIRYFNNKKIWLIEIVNNSPREVRVEASVSRNSNTIKNLYLLISLNEII